MRSCWPALSLNWYHPRGRSGAVVDRDVAVSTPFRLGDIFVCRVEGGLFRGHCDNYSNGPISLCGRGVSRERTFKSNQVWGK